MNYYTHHINDYITATLGLSLEEHGIYSLLLQHSYRLETGLPEADAFMLLGANTKKKRASVSKILEKFFFCEEKIWKNQRCIEEIARFTQNQERNKNIKKAGAERKQKSRDRRAALYQEACELGLDVNWKASANQILSAIRSIKPDFEFAHIAGADDDEVTRGSTVTNLGASQGRHASVTGHVTPHVTANPTPNNQHPTPNNMTVSKDTDDFAAAQHVKDEAQSEQEQRQHRQAVLPVKDRQQGTNLALGEDFRPLAESPYMEDEQSAQRGFSAPVTVTPVTTELTPTQQVKADAEALDKDKEAAMWMTAKALVMSTDKVTVGTAGMFVGGLVKRFGKELVHESVEAAIVERPAQMRSWLTAACLDKQSRAQGFGGRKQERLEQENKATATSWAQRKRQEMSRQQAEVQA